MYLTQLVLRHRSIYRKQLHYWYISRQYDKRAINLDQIDRVAVYGNIFG